MDNMGNMGKDNMNTNEFYVLYLKNSNDGSYLESLSPCVLQQTDLPEKAKRFKTPFDAKLFFFDNFKHIQDKFSANLPLKGVSVAKITVKYNVSFCDNRIFVDEAGNKHEVYRDKLIEDDSDSVRFSLKRD